jgi:hypothetical protein
MKIFKLTIPGGVAEFADIESAQKAALKMKIYDPVIDESDFDIPEPAAPPEPDYFEEKLTLSRAIEFQANKMIMAINSALNKTDDDVIAIVTEFDHISQLLRYGAMGMATGVVQQVYSTYPDYKEVFDYVLSEVQKFIDLRGLLR